MPTSGTTTGSVATAVPRAPHRLESRLAIRREIGDLTGYMTLMTATGGAAGYFIADDIFLEPNDAFTGQLAAITAGTGLGQTRRITTSDQTTGHANVTPNWTTPPDATSEIEVWHAGYPTKRVNAAIKQAILDSQGSARIRKRANPLAISSDFRSIQIPSEFTHISGVVFEKATANTFQEHKVVQSPAYLDEAPFAAAVLGDHIYLNPILTSATLITQVSIIGFGYPALPTTDSDIVEARSDYVVLMGAFFLEARDAAGGQLDPENHGSRAAGWFQQAVALRTLMHEPLDPNTVVVGP